MKKRNFKNDWALFSYITAYIKPYLGILLLATIALAGNLVLLLLRPYITKQVIDLGFATNDINVIEYYAVIYGLTIIGSVLCIFVENYFLKSFGQKIIYNIRAIVFQKILHKSHDEFYKLPIGNWVTRITNDVESLRTLYTDVLLNLASSGLMIIGILGFMYAINVPLAIIMTILLPIMGVIIWVFQKFSRKAFRQVRRSVAASNASIKELLNYIVIVKSYSGEKEIEERYNTVNKGFLEAGLFEVTTFSIFRPLVDGLFFVALIVIFTTTNLVDSVADAGTVFAFIQYMDRFFQPLKDIADKYNSLQSSLAGAERLVPLLEEKERNMVDEVPKELIPVESIEFDHVWFSYENNDVYALQDFTLHIKAGDFTGIVGPSGSGKSTLLSLLMGIYKPTKGSIYINGIDISKYDSSVLRHLMGYVFQQAYLFKGSIKDNLTLFDNSISHDEMVKAAKQVNLDSMIEQLPEGYNTPVGYLGSLLSDGQKQLLAFGRTLIRNIPILLLDEATANIDSHTEKQIQASIETIRGSSMEFIQSKDNKTIKHIVSLGQRKNRSKYGEYIVEGIRSIRDISTMGVIKAIVIRESKCKDKNIEALLSLESMQSIPTYIAQDPVFDKIDNTVNGQGIVAIVSKPKHSMESISIEDGVYITLDGVQDPGNLGTILRTAVAAGVKGIFLMKGTVDPYNDKTVRSTMSALHKIPVYEDVTLSMLNDLIAESNMSTYVTALDNSKPYHMVAYDKRCMLILGNEGNGVTPEVMNLCKHRIMIPMYGDIESLNVSVAAALCMYKAQEQLMC